VKLVERPMGFAIIGAVVGEYLCAAAGLGYLIQQAEGTFDTTGVFAGMVILAVASRDTCANGSRSPEAHTGTQKQSA
jgi:hypothetical protein